MKAYLLYYNFIIINYILYIINYIIKFNYLIIKIYNNNYQFIINQPQKDKNQNG